jgi:hypothetical protein
VSPATKTSRIPNRQPSVGAQVPAAEFHDTLALADHAHEEVAEAVVEPFDVIQHPPSGGSSEAQLWD